MSLRRGILAAAGGTTIEARARKAPSGSVTDFTIRRFITSQVRNFAMYIIMAQISRVLDNVNDDMLIRYVPRRECIQENCFILINEIYIHKNYADVLYRNNNNFS